MRQIKFRAKDFSGVWWYGFPAIGIETAVINPLLKDGTVRMGACIFIDKETIGQFTGIKDCKGNDIYEGDVVRCGSLVGNVTWVDGKGFYILIQYPNMRLTIDSNPIEIIGNIHE